LAQAELVGRLYQAAREMLVLLAGTQLLGQTWRPMADRAVVGVLILQVRVMLWVELVVGLVMVVRVVAPHLL
jgi:hypothetical protein